MYASIALASAMAPALGTTVNDDQRAWLEAVKVALDCHDPLAGFAALLARPLRLTSTLLRFLTVSFAFAFEEGFLLLLLAFAAAAALHSLVITA